MGTMSTVAVAVGIANDRWAWKPCRHLRPGESGTVVDRVRAGVFHFISHSKAMRKEISEVMEWYESLISISWRLLRSREVEQFSGSDP